MKNRNRRPKFDSLEGRTLLSTVPLTVTTLIDNPSGPITGQTTLRDAITAANAGSAQNQYQISFAVDGTISLSNQLPSLANNITINGPGESNLAIQGNNTFTILAVNSGETVNVSGVTIEGGYADNGNGGGISASGPLTVNNCTFSGNATWQWGAGGGIFDNGLLTVSTCTFDSNSADAGGGIYACDTTNVSNSIFSANHADSGYGGGIAYAYNGFSDTTLTVTDSQFHFNSAGAGGGISMGVWCTGETVIVSGCGFASNSASVGGGIANYTGTLTVSNSAFFNNDAGTAGGGIFNRSGATTTLGNNQWVFGDWSPDGRDVYNGGILYLDSSDAQMSSGLANDGTIILN